MEFFWVILTLLPFLVLIPGAWALAVWAARERDSQSKLVEKLTTREKDSLGIGESEARAQRADQRKSPAASAGLKVSGTTLT